MMTYWLLREKEAAKKRKQAMDDGKKWFRRARLAAQEGRTELAREAKLRALQAKDAYDNAVRALELIEMEKDVLRRQQAGLEIDRSGLERAEQIKRNFEAIGIDTTAAELDSLAERTDSDIAFARLRQNANAGLEPDNDHGLDVAGDEVAAPREHAPTDGTQSDGTQSDGGASSEANDAATPRRSQDPQASEPQNEDSSSSATPAKPPAEGGTSPFESIGPTRS